MVRADIICVIENSEWEAHASGMKRLAKRACLAALESVPSLMPLPCIFEIAIAIGDDAFIRRLNKTYRGKDKPTNVLSFPSADISLRKLAIALKRHYGAYHLGDIGVSAQTVKREAAEQNKTFDDHLTHMLVHSTLHLLGYDHEEDNEAEKMERKEIKILEKLKVSNPYLWREAKLC